MYVLQLVQHLWFFNKCLDNTRFKVYKEINKCSQFFQQIIRITYHSVIINKWRMTQEHLPSYSSGICRIKSSSGKLSCILAAKGSEQKSYQPSSAQRTNSCNVWKSLLNVSNSRHPCWVWLRLNEHKRKDNLFKHYAHTTPVPMYLPMNSNLMKYISTVIQWIILIQLHQKLRQALHLKSWKIFTCINRQLQASKFIIYVLIIVQSWIHHIYLLD